MFYNWYDPATCEKLTDLAGRTANPVYPFVSSVDNGWLATGLLVAARADDQVADAADAIRTKMDFGFYYDEAAGVRKDAAAARSAARSAAASGSSRRRAARSCRQLPRRGPRRSTTPATTTAPSTPSRGWRRTSASPPARSRPSTTSAPSAPSRRPATGPGPRRSRPASGPATSGVDVFEGTLPYRGMKIVPTWGGSMFEALMVPLFVPEETWGTTSWGVNHPLYVQAQIEHGMDEAGYGYWGFSPSNNPAGGYREYGVDALGMDGAGYTSDQERTDWDAGLRGLPRPRRRARADDVRRRRRHPARVVPRPALRPGSGAGQPGQAASATSTPTARAASTTPSPCAAATVSKRVPLARPGDDHGRARQRPGRRRRARLRVRRRAGGSTCSRSCSRRPSRLGGGR